MFMTHLLHVLQASSNIGTSHESYMHVNLYAHVNEARTSMSIDNYSVNNFMVGFCYSKLIHMHS